MNIETVMTDSKNEDFIKLINQLDADLNERNGEIQREFDQYNKVDNINDVVIMYKDKIPVACGAFKEFDRYSAELKRIFVRSENRREGLAKLLVAELEKMAKVKGYKYTILETGVKQHEAVSLYESCGYAVTQNFEPYIGNVNSVCMKKTL